MATWKKELLKRDNGELVNMQVPEIISASRSTDIPAFYADWFFYRLKKGYVAWNNPFNGSRLYVAFKNTMFIVFWSKNPRPLLQHLDELGDIGCYIQYSLNDYEKEGLEKGVPALESRIDTFKRLVDILGYGHVVWRFDPLVLTDSISIDDLLEKIDYIGNRLKGYTEKLVFSYADILSYKKVKANLKKEHVSYHEWLDAEMLDFAGRLSELNRQEGWNYALATCSERLNPERAKDGRRILFEKYGIAPNRCIDDELIIRLAYKDSELMNFLKVKFHPMPEKDLFGSSTPLPDDAIVLDNGTYATRGNNNDTGQRAFCGCIMSKDIGQYNTCIHACEYCYANASKDKARHNFKLHQHNPLSETITGD